MRRKPWFKSFASLLAVWFPLVVGEPSLLQPCPTHGAAVVAQADADGHGGHVAPASEGVEASESTPAQGHDRDAHHDCTCIGCCTASLTAITAPTAAETLVAELEPDTANPYLTADVLPRPGPEFSRPYTTGPPRA